MALVPIKPNNQPVKGKYAFMGEHNGAHLSGESGCPNPEVPRTLSLPVTSSQAFCFSDPPSSTERGSLHEKLCHSCFCSHGQLKTPVLAGVATLLTWWYCWSPVNIRLVSQLSGPLGTHERVIFWAWPGSTLPGDALS
ncbi:hypothetical protein AVEN_130002-1 [Araneus ventricosus]|uniref:Uncharacterized protein n=1 Tax=Araneus ventricosus TaxID=182803 RepID=A0A4Y2R4C6_ARAVE|nr:hypothetical protein AVEN_130002-1 [Araneus ventricosus]